MARRRATDAPVPNQALVAALVAAEGSERAAARLLGVSRSTINGVLRGVHGAGSKITNAVAKLAPEKRDAVGKVEYQLTASRGAGQNVVQAARGLAKQSKRDPGSVERDAQRRADDMARVGRAPDGSQLPAPEMPAPDVASVPESAAAGGDGDRDSLGRPLTAQQRLWAQAEELAGEDGDVYETFVALQLSGGSGGTGVDIEPM